MTSRDVSARLEEDAFVDVLSRLIFEDGLIIRYGYSVMNSEKERENRGDYSTSFT